MLGQSTTIISKLSPKKRDWGPKITDHYSTNEGAIGDDIHTSPCTVSRIVPRTVPHVRQRSYPIDAHFVIISRSFEGIVIYTSSIVISRVSFRADTHTYIRAPSVPCVIYDTAHISSYLRVRAIHNLHACHLYIYGDVDDSARFAGLGLYGWYCDTPQKSVEFVQRVRTCLLPSTLFRTVETDCSLVLGSNPLLIIGSLPTEQYTLKRSIESNYQVPARCTRRGVLYVTGGVVFAEGSLSLSLSRDQLFFREHPAIPGFSKTLFPVLDESRVHTPPSWCEKSAPFLTNGIRVLCCAARAASSQLSSFMATGLGTDDVDHLHTADRSWSIYIYIYIYSRYSDLVCTQPREGVTYRAVWGQKVDRLPRPPG